MKRESDRAGFSLLLKSVAEEFREKHEVIVVYPDQRAVFRCVGNYIGEELIDTFIGLPWAIVIYDAGLVVEDRPEDAVYNSQLAGTWYRILDN